jgi:hypothetical protein
MTSCLKLPKITKVGKPVSSAIGAKLSNVLRERIQRLESIIVLSDPPTKL